MKENVLFCVMFLIAGAIASCVGNFVADLIFQPKQHLCQCEYCKTVRQLEALEVVDSIFHERIIINVNKEE